MSYYIHTPLISLAISFLLLIGSYKLGEIIFLNKKLLSEFAEEYFVLNKNLNYKFMNVICDTQISKRHLIPGVVNIDNTSRPQIVEREDNNLYYDLINEFYKLSKIPILLNTSLNISEPICRNSDDTISSFLNSEIDILAIGNNLIKRFK
jgi:carbamoyltransferase